MRVLRCAGGDHAGVYSATVYSAAQDIPVTQRLRIFPRCNRKRGPAGRPW
jgi:hypothetical protein